MSKAETPPAPPAGSRLDGLTRGRVVHFLPSKPYPERPDPEPQAAIIAKVWTPDGCVNLAVVTETGGMDTASSVPYDPTGTRPYSWRFVPRT